MALQQRGRALTTPTTCAVTGATSHFANRFAAAQKRLLPIQPYLQRLPCRPRSLACVSSTVAFAKFVSSDTRKLLSRPVKATHPGRAFQIHLSLAPFSPLSLSFTIHIARRDIPVTDHYLERK